VPAARAGVPTITCAHECQRARAAGTRAAHDAVRDLARARPEVVRPPVGRAREVCAREAGREH
jgi:hypothetical protein